MSSDKPRLLIEDWLPVKELGIESRRERKVFTDLPPLNYLHVWWARRPIVASAGVLLAGLLPSWSTELAGAFPAHPELADEAA
jgi:putative DNA methylase